MALLAYSARRAAGALVVLLVVIWLIQFGVHHAMSPPVRSFPVPDYFLQFRHLAHQWDVAALEVGLALALLLGLGGAWRLRKRSVS